MSNPSNFPINLSSFVNLKLDPKVPTLTTEHKKILPTPSQTL